MASHDFYSCIYEAQWRLQEFRIICMNDNAHILYFYASPRSESRIMFLGLQMYEFADAMLLSQKCLWHEEIQDSLNCSEESMQNKLLPLLSYMFLGLFLDFPRLENKLSASDMKDSRKSGIPAGIVGSTQYKSRFNFLFNVMCSFFFNTYKSLADDVVIAARIGEVSNILAKEREHTLLLIEPARAHRFMKFLASIRPHNDERALTISYCSSVGEFWRIVSYSPLVSLKKTRESRIWKLNSSGRFSLLNCIFQFECIVNVSQSFTKVHLTIDNVTCDVLPYKAGISKSKVPNEKHFPARICLTIGPENGHGAQAVSLGTSSANPVTEIGETNTLEVQIQTPNTAGLKVGTAATTTRKIRNWGFDMSSLNSTDAKMDWTLYDPTTGKPIFNNVPSKSPFRSHKTPSFDGALTEQGGVVFAKDDYGKPMTWRLNRNLAGETLKWIVEASIWITYKPNTLYSETLRHDFRQEVDLELNMTSIPN